ncbi:hypothetical protein K8I85_16965, partial [bacterium]|nr:hypothetical protein [bacterium]
MHRLRSALFLCSAALPLLAAGPAHGAAVAPYPPSPVIESITWHETIDLGTDNDNWPVTWADDGHVYAA